MTYSEVSLPATDNCAEMLAMKDERIHALELYVAELEEELRMRDGGT